jgi:SAM-dependent methyltransferase
MLCKSENISGYLAVKDHLASFEEFSIFKCNDCGFIFTNDVPSAEEIGKYYRSRDYISHSDTRKGLMNRLYHIGRSLMLMKKYGMVRKAAAGNKLLDIGTGTGYFPGYMKKKGFQVTGVEIDPGARLFAEGEFSIRVYSPQDFLGGKIPGKFDVITLWHVLEHLDNFDLYIERMLAQLEPGGLLLIALPNCNAYDARHYREAWAGYDAPRHLWHFTPSTFKILAEKHGLKVTKMKRLPLDPFYNSMLSEKYKRNRFYLFSGMLTGKLALLESFIDIEKSSSVAYILKRLNE